MSENRTQLAFKIIEFFEPKGLTSDKKAKIIAKINTCDDTELANWEFIASKIDNHELRIASVINTVRERRFKKIADWQKKTVNNLGINIIHDGLTVSLDSFLDKQLADIFDDDYPDDK